MLWAFCCIYNYWTFAYQEVKGVKELSRMSLLLKNYAQKTIDRTLGFAACLSKNSSAMSRERSSLELCEKLL